MSETQTETPNPVGQIVKPENLALLHKRDRFGIMAAGLIVVAALGAVAANPGETTLALILALVCIAVVAGLVALVEWRAYTLRGIEADLDLQAEAGQAINGDWWQIVYADDHPGVTYVSIAMSEVAERHAMHGIKFNENGETQARWSSDVIALKTSTPVEIYYIWRGTDFDAHPAKIVSGLGRYRFDSVGREQQPLEGEGAITQGTANELSFGAAQSLELMRFTNAETAELARDNGSLGDLAKKAFERFKANRSPSLLGPQPDC